MRKQIVPVRKDVRVGIRISQEFKDYLQHRAAEMGLSFSEYVRMIMITSTEYRRYLDEQE